MSQFRIGLDLETTLESWKIKGKFFSVRKMILCASASEWRAVGVAQHCILLLPSNLLSNLRNPSPCRLVRKVTLLHDAMYDGELSDEEAAKTDQKGLPKSSGQRVVELLSKVMREL